MTDKPEKPKKKLTDKQLAAAKKNKRDNWKPGESGNPNGKPRGTPNRGTILKRYLEATFKTDDGKTKKQPFGLNGKPITVAEAVDLALLKKALGGNMDAIREVKDTMYGKMTDKKQFTGPDGGPIPITIIDDL